MSTGKRKTNFAKKLIGILVACAMMVIMIPAAAGPSPGATAVDSGTFATGGALWELLLEEILDIPALPFEELDALSIAPQLAELVDFDATTQSIVPVVENNHSYYTLRFEWDPETETFPLPTIDLRDYNIVYGNFHLLHVDLLSHLFLYALWSGFYDDLSATIFDITLTEGGATGVFGSFSAAWRNTAATGINIPRWTWDIPGFGGFTWSSSDDSVFRFEELVVEGDEVVRVFAEQPGTAYLRITFNDYPITIQKPVTVTPWQGDTLPPPTGFLFDPHVVRVDAGETALTTLSLVPEREFIFPVAHPGAIAAGAEDDLYTFFSMFAYNTNPEVAQILPPEVTLAEIIEYAEDINWDELDEAEIIELYEELLRPLRELRIEGLAPGRTVITWPVLALVGEGFRGGLYPVEVIVTPGNQYIATNWDELAAFIGDANGPGTITVRGSFPAGNQITIPPGRNVTLVGEGPAASVLTQTTNLQRHFVVQGNAANASSLTLGNNITLSGIQGNTTANIGGVQVGANGNFTMEAGSVIEHCRWNLGGGVALVGGAAGRATFTMNGGEIRYNSAGDTAAQGGGGVNVGANSDMYMIGGLIRNNEATAGNGGGVRVAANFTMHDGIIEDNTAVNNGGGVMLTGTGANFRMYGGRIRNNTANGAGAAFAGGVRANAGATFAPRDGDVYGNTPRDIVTA